MLYYRILRLLFSAKFRGGLPLSVGLA